MTMAPRLSMIASDTRKVFRAIGTRLPSSVNTPIAKAISVAAVHPCVVCQKLALFCKRYAATDCFVAGDDLYC